MSMAYSIKNILLQEPTKVTGAIMSIVNVLVVSNAISWDEVQLGTVNTGLVLLLTLFYTAPLVASKSKLEELAAAQPDG